jgi:hypothetical protein
LHRKSKADQLKNISGNYKEKQGDKIDKVMFMQDIIDYLDQDLVRPEKEPVQLPKIFYPDPQNQKARSMLHSR